MLKDINVRFFAYNHLEWGLQNVETSEEHFNKLAVNAPVTYERHTIFDNGCRQVCLTVQCTLDGELI